MRKIEIKTLINRRVDEVWNKLMDFKIIRNGTSLLSK
jgi:hypothetical protein